MGSTAFWYTNGSPTPLGRIVWSGEVIADEPHVPGPLRRMDSWVLSCVTEGRGLHRDARGVTRPITAGMVTLIAPGTWHWYGTRTGETWSELFAVFDGPLFDLLAQTGVLTDRLPERPATPASLALLRSVVVAGPGGRAAADRRLLTLAEWLAELSRTTDQGPLERAAHALANDLEAELDLHVLAERLGLSYDTFRRRFTAAYGLPPAAYRNASRMEAAAKLLTLTDRGLRDIAHRLGYGDEFHFSTRFRQHHGLAPSHYRRRQG